MTSIRRALGLSFIERYALIFLNLASYVLIARLLTPEEIGLYSVTAAIVGIAQVLREFSIGNYLIQAQNLDRGRLDTALGISLPAGAAMFVIGLLAAPWIAKFYQDERLTDILYVVCISFLILPFCSIATALLRRHMSFGALMVISIVAGVGSFVTTVVMALMDFGPVSLAWGTVVANAITAVYAWHKLGRERRPGRMAFTHWRELVEFGRPNTFAGVITTVATDVNDLCAAKILGFAQVALISRALGMMNIVQRDLLNAVRNVAYPAFAAAQRDGKNLEPLFIASTAAVTALTWTFFGMMALFPLEALRLLAGPQWDAAAGMVTLFACTGICLSFITFVPNLIMATGRADLTMRAEISASMVRLVLVIGAALIFREMKAVAIAYAIASVLTVPVFYYFKNQCVPNDWGLMLRRCAKSAQVAAVCLVLPLAVSVHAGLGRTTPIPLTQFGLVCVATVAIWLVALRLCRHDLAREPIYQRLMARLGWPTPA